MLLPCLASSFWTHRAVCAMSWVSSKAHLLHGSNVRLVHVLPSLQSNTATAGPAAQHPQHVHQPGHQLAAAATQRQDIAATVTTSHIQAAAGGFTTGVTTMATGQGFKKTFYKRKLPTPPSIAFASSDGRQLFAEALASGHMSGFFRLMEQFSTQDEPSFCGLASLAMVLNALAIDPRRTWKGAWRWFHEQMLDCCRPLEDVKKDGITLPQAACLARCNGARVQMCRYGSFTLDELRRQVIEVCSSGEQHLVVSYSRRTFLQTGDGHFSPIGGYHAGRDLVLILDTARFKYPPHWVPLPMLFEAMQYVDPVTQLPRGFLRMSAQPLLGSVLLTLDVRSSCWQEANTWLREYTPQQMQAYGVQYFQRCLRACFDATQAAAASASVDVEQLLTQLLHKLPPRSLDAFLVVRDNSLTSPQPLRQSSINQSTAEVATVQPSSASADHHGQDGCAAVDHTGISNTNSNTNSSSSSSHTGACDPSDLLASGSCLPVGARQQLLAELRALPLYQMVQHVMQQTGQIDTCTALACDLPEPHSHPHHSPDGHTAMTSHHTSHHTLHHTSHHGPASSSSPQPSRPATAQIETGVMQSNQPSLQQPRLLSGSTRTSKHRRQGNSGYLAEKATMLLLMHEWKDWPQPDMWQDVAAGKAWAQLMDISHMSIVDAELAFLREQWAHLDEVVAGGNLEHTCGSGSCVTPLDCAAQKCSS